MILEKGIDISNKQTFSSPLLKVVAEYVNRNQSLTMRIIKINEKTEQIDISRKVPDFLDNNDIPLSAAHLLISDNGDAKFFTISGHVSESCIKEINDIENQLKKFDIQYRLCTGLPASLPEIKYFPGNFQSYLEYPYPHARSKGCLHWHQPSNRVSIRERIGVQNYRCPPCKRYFNNISQQCRNKESNKNKSRSVVNTNQNFDNHVSNKRKNTTKPNLIYCGKRKITLRASSLKSCSNKCIQTEDDDVAFSLQHKDPELITDINDLSAKGSTLIV